MSDIDLSKGFKTDINEIAEQDKYVAFLIISLIRLIEEDDRLSDLLTQDGFNHSTKPEFDIATWGEMIRIHKISLWRLKPKGDVGRFKKYRIIYTYDGRGQSDLITMLAVIPRSDNYETDTPIAQRIITEYDYLDLPRY